MCLEALTYMDPMIIPKDLITKIDSPEHNCYNPLNVILYQKFRSNDYLMTLLYQYPTYDIAKDIECQLLLAYTLLQ